MVVRPAASADIESLAGVLSRAFAGDPLFTWYGRHGEGRLARLRECFALLLRTESAGLAQTYTTHDLAGVAVWQPPGFDLGWRVRDLGHMRAWASFTGWRRLPRAWRVADVLARHHPDGPHYHLALLGVEPDRQGAGLGTALLEPMLDVCDRARAAATLTTANESTLPFYERRGFDVRAELRLPCGAPRAWLMAREPSRSP